MEINSGKDYKMGTRRINPEYIETIKQLAKSNPYFSLLSMSIKSLGEGNSVLEIDLDEKHLQNQGMVHGGVFSSLIDAAAFWATFTEVEEDKGMTTIEMKLNYLAPAQKGRLIANGRCIKIGNTLALGEATVTDGHGKLLSHGTATFMILSKPEYRQQKQTVPKFI